MNIVNFLKSSDFIRALVYIGTAIGVTLDPSQIEAIVAGGFALSGLVHAVRGAAKK